MNSDFSPKVYRLSRGWLMFLIAAGLPMTIGSFFGMWYFGSGHEARDVTARLVLVAMSLGMALLGLACVCSPFYSKLLVIYPDYLQVPSLFRTKTVRRDDIIGFRIRSAQGAKILQLEAAGARKVNISMLFKPDAAFEQWFEGIPSLDALDYAASLRDAESDPGLGDSPSARRENVRRAGKIARVLYFATLGLCGWLMFEPRPYALVFLLVAALPWIAIWLCWKYKASFSIDDTRAPTVRGDLIILILVPTLLLGVRALRDIQLVAPAGLVMPTIIGLVLMVVCIVRVAPYYRKNIGRLLMLGIFLPAYPAGTLAIANAIFDGAPSESHQVEVLRKHVASGKSTSYYLSVPPWGPFDKENDVQVSGQLYWQTEVGQRLCIVLHPGAIGLPWYEAGSSQLCMPAM